MLLLGTGVVAHRWVGQLAAHHDTIERLPMLHAPDFHKARIGAEVLVAGTLSERNPILFEQFVTLIRYRYAAPEGEQKGPPWVEESRQTPPLWLAAADGDVRVTNANYRLNAVESARRLEVSERGLQHWQSRPDRVGGTAEEATHAASGFVRGDKVLAYGKVRAAEGVGTLDAVWIYGGTREQWLEQSAREFSVARLVPWTLWALAAVFGGLAAQALSRRRARPI